MRNNKTMIRFYFLLLILSASLVYIVDLNGQFHFLNLNSPWISNAFCFSILSSILAGVLVAMAAEIRQYQLHKRDSRNALYNTAGKLYALISVQRACIAYYITNSAVSIPKNTGDEHARQPIITRIENFRTIDYSPFSNKDSISLALKSFREKVHDIESTVRNLVEIQIAYNSTIVSFIENHGHQEPVTAASPLMLKALQEVHAELNGSLEALSEFCSTFEKINNGCFNWSRDKKAVDDIAKKIEADPYYKPSNK